MTTLAKCNICQQERKFTLKDFQECSHRVEYQNDGVKGFKIVIICRNCQDQLKNQLMDRESFMNFFKKDDFHDWLMVEDEHDIFTQILRGSSDITVKLVNEMLSNYSAGGLFIDQDQLDEMKEIYANDDNIFLGELDKYLYEINNGNEHLDSSQDDGDCDVKEELTFFCKGNCKIFKAHGESGCKDAKCSEYGYCNSCINRKQCSKLNYKCKLAEKNKQNKVE